MADAPDWTLTTDVSNTTLDVNVGTIQGGNIVDVINSPGTVVGVGSDQAVLYQNLNISETGTIPSGGVATITLATIANSSIPPTSSVPSPTNALGWVYSLTSTGLPAGDLWAPQVVDGNGHIYLQPGGQAYANGGFYSNNATYSTSSDPVGYINDGTDLVVQLVIEGTAGDAYDITGSLVLVAYTSSIPPRGKLTELDYLYGGVLNQVNNVANVAGLPLSTAKGISIADALAPADSYNTGTATTVASGNVTLVSLPANIILRWASYQGESSLSSITSLGISGVGITAENSPGTNQKVWQPPGGLVLKSATNLTLYASTGGVTVLFSYGYTTL